MTDLSELSLYLLKEKKFDDRQMKVADVSYDNEINTADLALLKQFVSKKATHLGPKN